MTNLQAKAKMKEYAICCPRQTAGGNLDVESGDKHPVMEMDLRENGKYSACEVEKKYLLLVTADWNHDADEWIGIYSDNDELRIAYEKSLSEFEVRRKEGHYCDAQYLAIVEFTAKESKEHILTR